MIEFLINRRRELASFVDMTSSVECNGEQTIPVWIDSVVGWRRLVAFSSSKAEPVEPLAEKKTRLRWSFVFLWWHFEVNRHTGHQSILCAHLRQTKQLFRPATSNAWRNGSLYIYGTFSLHIKTSKLQITNMNGFSSSFSSRQSLCLTRRPLLRLPGFLRSTVVCESLTHCHPTIRSIHEVEKVWVHPFRWPLVIIKGEC